MNGAADACQLAVLLRRAVARQLVGCDDLALMYSGGLDSSVLAVIARKHCDVTLYTAGIEGSHDLEWVRGCASIIDLPVKEIVISEEDVLRSLRNVVRNGVREPKWVSTFVAQDLVFERVSETHVMSGQGADELFGGYGKYAASPDPVSQMRRDMDNLLRTEMPALMGLASAHSKALIVPFLDSEIISFAEGVPLERKLCEADNKMVLREAARLLGVPGMMACRKKKAMQYGTGVSGVIKRHLRATGMELSELISAIKI